MNRYGPAIEVRSFYSCQSKDLETFPSINQFSIAAFNTNKVSITSESVQLICHLDTFKNGRKFFNSSYFQLFFYYFQNKIFSFFFWKTQIIIVVEIHQTPSNQEHENTLQSKRNIIRKEDNSRRVHRHPLEFSYLNQKPNIDRKYFSVIEFSTILSLLPNVNCLFTSSSPPVPFPSFTTKV